MHAPPPLPSGYSLVPPGKIANVVTCLEMIAPPRPRPAKPMGRPLSLERLAGPGVDDYRALFRSVGQDWLWFSRLVMPDEELSALLSHPDVECFALRQHKTPIGILELDFREAGQCELAFFGVVREAIGQGAGRFLMDQAIARAWARPISRLWVHTCTLDHPGAVGFYQRSGFTPYAFMVEVADDPRLTGHLPRHVAPQVPLIEPKQS
jgi:GNAT superfamily N-acetyltransferase